MVQKRAGPTHVALSISSLLSVLAEGVCRFSNGIGRAVPREYHLQIHAGEAEAYARFPRGPLFAVRRIGVASVEAEESCRVSPMEL